MHIAYLARAENELLASALEDELRFVLREDMRGAIVLLRQLLLPLHHFAGEANDHVVLIGFSVNRDGAECGALDLHGLTLVPNLSTRLCLRLGRRAPLRCHRCRPAAFASRRSPDPGPLHASRRSLPLWRCGASSIRRPILPRRSRPSLTGVGGGTGTGGGGQSTQIRDDMALWEAASSGDERALLVLLGLASDAWEGGQLQHGRMLAFAQSREQHDLPAGEFERIVM